MNKELAILLENELNAQRDQLKLIEEAEARKPLVKEEIKKYEQMLAIYAGKDKKPVTKTRKPTRRKNGEAKTMVLDVFRNNPDLEFCAADIAPAVKIKAASVSTILKMYERQRLIRLTHKGGSRNSTKYFKLAKTSPALEGL